MYARVSDEGKNNKITGSELPVSLVTSFPSDGLQWHFLLATEQQEPCLTRAPL